MRRGDLCLGWWRRLPATRRLPEVHALDRDLIHLGKPIEHAPDRAVTTDVLGVDGAQQPVGRPRRHRFAAVLLPKPQALFGGVEEGGEIALGQLQLQPRVRRWL